MRRRVATEADVDVVTRTIALAFEADPIWAPALRGFVGGPDRLASYWRLFVDESIESCSTFLIDDGAAVSIWVPPGGDELSPTRLDALETLLAAALTHDDNAALHALYERFEASREPLAEHWYLSLLATHPDHRGRGVGQTLLAADLAAHDETGLPAYLESTNPANDHRYERAGFRRIGGFEAVIDRAPVTAMWRVVGGSD